VAVSDKGDGSYELKYTPTAKGKYALQVEVDGRPLGGKNPFHVVVTPSGPDASNTVAHGAGLQAARLEQSSSFTVEARDKFNNPLTVGGHQVGGKLVHVASGKSFPITATDNRDGTYKCTYPDLSLAGDFEVIPTLNGAPIKNAPYKLKVNPGGFSISNTEVSFESTSLAGKPGGKVHLKDNFQNYCLTGGDAVEANLTPLSLLQIKARDNKNGTYDLVIPADLRGKFEVNVSVNGKPVPGGSSVIEVREEPLPKDIQGHLPKLFPKTHHVWSKFFLKLLLTREI